MKTTTLPALLPEITKVPSIGASNPSAYRVNVSLAVLAAIVSAAAITVYMMTVPRMLGCEEMDIGITVGYLSDPSGGWMALLMRIWWHVGNGLVYIVFYVAALLVLRRQSSIGTGILFGIFLWLFGPMTSIPLGLDFFPSVASGELTNPGIFMLRLQRGWSPAITDLGAHLVHGILTGVIYKHRLVTGRDSTNF